MLARRKSNINIYLTGIYLLPELSFRKATFHKANFMKNEVVSASHQILSENRACDVCFPKPLAAVHTLWLDCGHPCAAAGCARSCGTQPIPSCWRRLLNNTSWPSVKYRLCRSSLCQGPPWHPLVSTKGFAVVVGIASGWPPHLSQSSASFPFAKVPFQASFVSVDLAYKSHLVSPSIFCKVICFKSHVSCTCPATDFKIWNSWWTGSGSCKSSPFCVSSAERKTVSSSSDVCLANREKVQPQTTI